MSIRARVSYDNIMDCAKAMNPSLVGKMEDGTGYIMGTRIEDLPPFEGKAVGIDNSF